MSQSSVLTDKEGHREWLKLGDRLALQRTQLAAERTLMAWIRTAFSMIGFGFTIVRFFQFLREKEGVSKEVLGGSPRNLGILLVVLGTLCIVIGTWEHWHAWQEIKQMGGRGAWSPALLVALLVLVLGMTAFVGLVLRIGPLEG
jgi:putative membrane protein